MDRPHKPGLTAIAGAGKGPKPWRRRALDETEQITCWKCEELTGVATSVGIHIIQSPRRRPDGRATGGRKILACALCLARGQVIELAKS